MELIAMGLSNKKSPRNIPGARCFFEAAAVYLRLCAFAGANPDRADDTGSGAGLQIGR
jgi:hypothetical protein